MPTLGDLFPIKKPLDPTQSAVSTLQTAPGTVPSPVDPMASEAAGIATNNMNLPLNAQGKPYVPPGGIGAPPQVSLTPNGTAPSTTSVAPQGAQTGVTSPAGTGASGASAGTTPVLTSNLPQQGSAMAFQQAFGKLMQNAQYNQGLQDQMYKLIKAKYDGVSAQADPSLPPAVQEAIRNGDQSMIDFQIQSLRSQLQGRSTDMTNSLNYLVTGYTQDAKALADRQAAAQQTVNKWITDYGSNLSHAGITQDELNQYLSTGQLTPALATKLMNTQTITQQRYAAQYGAGTAPIGSVTGAATLDAGGHSYDFSSNGPSGIYATDPNWGAGVSSALQSIGTLTDPSQIDRYIQGVAPGSPITSQMVTAASQQYGVPWELLMAVMQQESQFGTAGAATKTFNPGNVGNTGSATSNMGDWQAGVDAMAKKIADSEVAASSKPSYAEYGTLANTNFQPSNTLDSAAYNYLTAYLKTGTTPSFTSLFGRSANIPINPKTGLKMTVGDVIQRANDLMTQATGSPLPDQTILKSNKALIGSNNQLANQLKTQEQTVKANVDFSLANMKKNDLNSSGFKPLDNLINTIQNAFQDPATGQMLAQNVTIQNELASLLSVKNASGSTVYDKLESAGIITSSDSPEQIQAKVNALVTEAGNAADAINQVNAGLYSQIDPLQTDPNNPNRQGSGTSNSSNDPLGIL